MKSISNNNLANYIKFKLDKEQNLFSEEELNHITYVVLDYKDEEDNGVSFLSDLLKLNLLKSITLRNGVISNNDIKLFSNFHNLIDISFENCDFEDINLITLLNLTSISFINCRIDNYSFILSFKNLEELTIVNGVVEIEIINMLNKLKYLQISHSKILDDYELNLPYLEHLYIDNTNMNNFSFLNKLNNLKRVSIDEKQYNQNKELFNNLMKKNIIVLEENMVEFGGDNNGI